MPVLTDFAGLLGWCTLINTVILCLATFALTVMRSTVLSVHRKMFAVEEKDLMRLYVQYLGNYKILILVFNLVPYLAIRLAG